MDAPALDQRRHGRGGLLDRRRFIVAMQVEHVDPVGTQPLQARLDRP